MIAVAHPSADQRRHLGDVVSGQRSRVDLVSGKAVLQDLFGLGYKAFRGVETGRKAGIGPGFVALRAEQLEDRLLGRLSDNIPERNVDRRPGLIGQLEAGAEILVAAPEPFAISRVAGVGQLAGYLRYLGYIRASPPRTSWAPSRGTTLSLGSRSQSTRGTRDTG